MSNKKLWTEIATSIYARLYYQYQNKHANTDFQPFSISVAVFSWRFGCQKQFCKVIKVWRNESTKIQEQAIINFIRKIGRVNPINKWEHDRHLFRRCLRESFQRLWVLKRRSKRLKRMEQFSSYLKETGLARYYKAMQKAGLGIQI